MGRRTAGLGAGRATAPGPARLGGALAALLLSPLGASGQGAPVELGVGVARAGDPAPELSDDRCAADEAWTAEARAGLRISRAVRLETTGGFHLESDVRCATPGPPVPPAGPHTSTEVVVPEAGYPYFTTDLRLAFEPSSPAGSAWLRAFGGYGRIWGKDIGYWLAGGGLVFGGRLRTLFELEWNWFDVPFREITREYEDAVLVSETETPGKASRRTFRLRLGFRWPL